MNIDLSTTIKSLEGKTLTINGEEATVRAIAQKVLRNSSSDNHEKKIKLAKRLIESEDSASLKAEEISLIKKSLREMPYTAEFVYQFEQAIDPVEETEE